MAERREQRVRQRLAVWVMGRDARGNRFQQTAKVVDISRLGARLGEIRCLRAVGEIVELKCHGKKAQFKVVWIDDFSGQAGVRSLEPGKDLWGVALPAPRLQKYEPMKAAAPGVGQSAAQATGGWVSGSSVPASPFTSFTSGTATGRATSASITPARSSNSPAAAAQPQMAERRERKHARHRCTGGVEVRRGGLVETGEKVWGRLVQLSLGGCFVAAMHPFAANTKVTLFLGVQDTQLRVKGVVCRSSPGEGMGIMFTEVDEQNQRHLDELTKKLAKGGKFSQFA